MKGILSLCFVLMSCSSYVERWHRKIDSLEEKKKGVLSKNERISRKQPYGDTHIPSKRLNRQLYLEQNSKGFPLDYRRNYKQENGRRTIDSLYDNGNEDSLWSGVGQDNYLFTRNNVKKYGDIVIIDMTLKVKGEILSELNREFPETTFGLRKKKTKNSEIESILNAKNQKLIYDRLSSIVVEEVNKDHLVVKGKKEIVYKDKKRLVEIQALIARRDVSNTDTVHSDKILDLVVSVVR